MMMHSNMVNLRMASHESGILSIASVITMTAL